MKVRHYYCSFQILLLLLSFFIITISVVDAQQPSDSTPSSTVVDDGDDYELEGKGVNPSMAIIIIVLVLGFFITGCISIYVQQCSDNSSIGERPVVGQPMMMRAVQRGVDQSVIDTFPTFLYSDVKELKIGKGALECAICINEFEEDETLRLLPVCDHVFHHECIDAWLVAHATCPVCRANLVADTGELSKVENNNDHSELSPSDHYLVEVTVEAEPPKGRVPRSHSTGHSLVRVIRPNEDRERFTLRLPDEVRKQLLVARPRLKRTTSLVALPRVSSSRRGYRGGGEGSGSSRYGRFFGRWTTKTNGSDGDASTGSKRFSRTAVTPLESLPNLPV